MYDEEKQICCGVDVHDKDPLFICCGGEWVSKKENDCIFGYVVMPKDLSKYGRAVFHNTMHATLYT